MNIRKLLTPLALVLAVALLAAPVQAYTYREPNGYTYDLNDLFYTSLHRGETTTIQVPENTDRIYVEFGWGQGITFSEYDEYRLVQLDYVTRYPTTKNKELHLTDNATVASNIAVVIPKTHTLVVEQGATLYVYGKLIIEGTLENNGMIVVGNKKLSEADTDKLSELRVTGYLDNFKTIRAYRGSVVNQGELNNEGTIQSYNKIGLDGIVNQAGALLYNTGAIQLENTDDMGLRNDRNGTIENAGTITRKKTAGIIGSIRGNAATLAAE